MWFIDVHLVAEVVAVVAVIAVLIVAVAMAAIVTSLPVAVDCVRSSTTVEFVAIKAMMECMPGIDSCDTCGTTWIACTDR